MKKIQMKWAGIWDDWFPGMNGIEDIRLVDESECEEEVMFLCPQCNDFVKAKGKVTRVKPGCEHECKSSMSIGELGEFCNCGKEIKLEKIEKLGKASSVEERESKINEIIEYLENNNG